MKKLNLNYVITAIMTMPELEFNDINCVYISKRNKANNCMCGCSGTYFYNEVNKIKAGKNRGYDVTAEEVNEREVQTVLDLFLGYRGLKNIEVIEDKNNTYIFTMEISNRGYTIYTI